MKFIGRRKGFQNYADLQKCFLEYAAGMQRIAILPQQYPFDKKHNRGYDIDCDPYLYYDFDHITYYSNAYKATTPLSCIRVSDLDMSQFSESDTKVFKAQNAPVHISAKDDQSYRLIIIEHTAWNWTHTCDFHLPKIVLPYSEKIRLIAMQVINKIMKSHKNLNCQLNGSIEESYLRLNYCCVHARRTDRLHTNESLTNSMNIKRNLDANKDIDRNTPIYLMTDEPNDHFYDGLKKYYPYLFRYSDFAELYHLRHPKNGETPNNYLLFAIEHQIRLMSKIAYRSETAYIKRLSNGSLPRRWRLWPLERKGQIYFDIHGDFGFSLIEFYPLRMLWKNPIWNEEAKRAVMFIRRLIRYIWYKMSKYYNMITS